MFHITGERNPMHITIHSLTLFNGKFMAPFVVETDFEKH